VLSSCARLHLRHEVEQIAAHVVVVVAVGSRSGTAPIYAVAFAAGEDGTPQAIGLQPVGENGVASFLLRLGRSHRIGAWSDLDGDRVYDAGGPAATSGDVELVPLEAMAERAAPVPLRLDAGHVLPPGPAFAVPADDDDGSALPLHIGEIASLDDARFSPENGDRGMRRPFEFLQ
jgi:hypothetical protein